MATLHEMPVPLSTAILIIINEPHGVARLSVRLLARLYRDDVMLHTYMYIQHGIFATPLRRITMPRSRRRAISDFDYPCPKFNVGT